MKVNIVTGRRLLREPSRFLCFLSSKREPSRFLLCNRLTAFASRYATIISAGARKRGIFLLSNIYQIFAVIFGKNLEVIAVEFGIERRIAEEIMVAVFGPVLFRHL